MADIKQDLLSLQYSQNFDIKRTQEANVDLKDGLVIGNQITVAYRENGDSAESGFYMAVMIRDAD